MTALRDTAPPAVGEAVKPRRVGALDSLRFVAAAAVLFQHGVEQQGPLGQKIVGMFSPGVFGVVLFFLISGYVIPMSAGRKFNLQSFVIRRVLRIYPLVLVAFAAAAVLSRVADWPALANARSASGYDWIANLLLVQDYVGATPIHGVTWTLSLELFWYALFAGLTLWKGRRFAEPLFIVLPLTLLAFGALSWLIDHRIPLARLGMIYAAALGCQVFEYHAGRVAGRRLAINAAIFAGVMTISNMISFGHFKHPLITMGQAVVPWLTATVFFLTVTTIPRIMRSRLLDNRLLAWLGVISFSVYLLHPFALALAEATVTVPWRLPVGLLLTLVISAASYRLIELPAISLSKRLTPQRPMALPPASPVG